MSTVDIDAGGLRHESIRDVWAMGFNTCHAALLLRDDLNKHLQMAREIGFRYIRFHNIFGEQVGLYRERDDGTPVYDFTSFDRIFDAIISHGLLPFFEISFCPPALKSSENTITHYQANTSAPRSMERWADLVRTTVKHAVERYGVENVAHWYFEVWNEPDLAFFDGDQTAYFELYDHTAMAVKSVSERLRIGGPATSKCAWIPEFIAHVETGSPVTGGKPAPCDFVSTHAYPSDLAFLNSAEGSVELQSSTIMYDLYSVVRARMDASTLKGLPLIMGEWNSSAGPYAWNHDEKNNGAFLVKTLVELRNVIDGSLYWNLSDIYEEGSFHYTPFHGGYGIFTVNSIRKSSGNAFDLLNRLKGDDLRIETDVTPTGCGVVATRDPDLGTVRVLCYHYQEPDQPATDPWQVELRVDGLLPGALSLRRTEITDDAGSPYELWREMGSPDYLTLETHQALVDRSRMAESDQLIHADARGLATVSLSVAAGDVALLEIQPPA